MTARRIVRVLLAEDHESDVQLVKDALANVPDTDYAVHAVARFADAQDAIERSAFDIVLLGLELPDSPVNDTLRRIASLPVAVPVIVLTPHPDDETTTTAVREGAEDYFVRSELNGVWLARAIRNAIERHRIRAAWRMSEERLARIIDSAMDGIITADDGLRIVIFNPAAERMFECSADVAIGQRLDRFIPDPEHAPASFRARRAGGDEFPAEASISQTTVAGRRLFTVILRDVTKRLQTEETLHQSEERLQTALEVGRMGTWTFDFDTKEVWADDKMLKLVGRTRADWPKGPQGAAELVHPEDRAAVWEGLRIDPSDPGPAMRSVEMRIVLPDGSPRWLAVTGRLERDHNGHGRIVGIASDVSARKQSDAAQLRSHKLEALGTLAGGVAHDFNNILLAIMGNAGLAEADLPPDHPVRDNLAEITRATNRAADLVRRILGFSRPQDERQSPISLRPVVEEAVNLLRASLPAMIHITTTYADDLPHVTANATQMHQVVVNLGTNAAHALGVRGGDMQVALDAVTLSAEDAAGLSGLHEGLHVRLTVTDTGSGIDQATLDRIFDPYFTTKPASQGTGLGLAVVHGIIVSHHGAITVRSTFGQGSAFTIYLPAAHGATEQAHLAADGVPRGRGEHVLFIDDEPALVRLGIRVLERLGYRVTGCQDPSAALEMFRSDPKAFDLVLTDLAMPPMTGFDVAQAILALRPSIPVLLTSGYMRTEDRDAAVALGIRDVLPKPTTRELLGRTLRQVLDTKDGPS